MHNVGKIHKEKVKIYYQNWMNSKAQEMIDKVNHIIF